jgi:hypothetical protein
MKKKWWGWRRIRQHSSLTIATVMPTPVSSFSITWTSSPRSWAQAYGTRCLSPQAYRALPHAEEAGSAGPVKWVVPAWEVPGYWQRAEGGWRAGLKRLRVNESEVGVC